MAKVKAGEGECPICGERIVWRRNDTGTVSCFCQDCDFQGYAKAGTEAQRIIMAQYGQPGDPVAVVDDKPEPKPGLFGGLL